MVGLISGGRGVGAYKGNKKCFEMSHSIIYQFLINL